jgi:hypothetical protein
MSYNELGQLTSKTRRRGYESQNFRYNICGWLTHLGCEVFNEGLQHHKTLHYFKRLRIKKKIK